MIQWHIVYSLYLKGEVMFGNVPTIYYPISYETTIQRYLDLISAKINDPTKDETYIITNLEQRRSFLLVNYATNKFARGAFIGTGAEPDRPYWDIYAAATSEGRQARAKGLYAHSVFAFMEERAMGSDDRYIYMTAAKPSIIHNGPPSVESFKFQSWREKRVTAFSRVELIGSIPVFTKQEAIIQAYLGYKPPVKKVKEPENIVEEMVIREHEMMTKLQKVL